MFLTWLILSERFINHSVKYICYNLEEVPINFRFILR